MIETGDRFNVVQFFEGDSYEYVRRMILASEAVEAFNFYTNNVAARTGITRRVIITNMLDETTLEWQFGKGITFGLKKE